MLYIRGSIEKVSVTCRVEGVTLELQMSNDVNRLIHGKFAGNFVFVGLKTTFSCEIPQTNSGKVVSSSI